MNAEIHQGGVGISFLIAILIYLFINNRVKVMVRLILPALLSLMIYVYHFWWASGNYLTKSAKVYLLLNGSNGVMQIIRHI